MEEAQAVVTDKNTDLPRNGVSVQFVAVGVVSGLVGAAVIGLVVGFVVMRKKKEEQKKGDGYLDWSK